VMLVKLDAAGNQAEAVARAERLFSRLLLKGTADLFDTIEDLVKVLDPSLLKPTTLFRLGQSLDRAPEGLRPLAERLFAACAREPGPYAAKALVRAAQVRLDSGGETKGAREYLERFRAAPDVPADLKARASELEARIQELLDREKEISPRFAGKGIALESEPPPRQVQQPQDSPVAPSMPMRAAPDASAAPEAGQQVKAPEPSGSGLAQVMECSLGGMTRDALALVLEGGRQMDLSFTDMVAVAVGVVPEPAPPPAPPRNVLYTDLVIAWGGPGRPARVIRLRSSTLNLHSLYPGMPPADAYEVFLQHVLDQSGATALPDASALRRGEYPQYPDKESFIRAIHG